MMSVIQEVKNGVKEGLASKWGKVGLGWIGGILTMEATRSYVESGYSGLIDFAIEAIIVIPVAAVLSIILGSLIGAISMVVYPMENSE